MKSKLCDDKNRNIYIGNFNCEDIWNKDNTIKLPTLDLKDVRSVIYNLEELIIYLANPEDIVILRNLPNQDFIKQLKTLGIKIPKIVTPYANDINKSISELVLNDTQLLCLLKNYVNNNLIENKKTNLVPYGATEYENKIAEIISAQITSDYLICSRLNNKLLLNFYAKQMKINFPETVICHGVYDLKCKGRIFLEKFKKVIVKEVYGSGGSGLVIIDCIEKLDQICKYIDGTFSARGTIVLQRWYDSLLSYNHQYIIMDDCIIPHCFSKQVIVHQNGKIMGSVFNDIDRAGKELWKRLYKMCYVLLEKIKETGYRGVVGFDSIFSQQENVFFPVIDINCRINLSTIFWEIISKYFDSKHSYFICREYVLSHPVAFKTIQSLLGDNEYSKKTKEGIVILNFASLNYNILNAKSKYGRIFYGIFANTQSRLRELQSFAISDAMTIL